MINKSIKKLLIRNFSNKINKNRGFMDYYRNNEPYRQVKERIKDPILPE